MNLLAHFLLARRDLERPAAAVGAMLPDLWRMVDRRVRPAPRGIGRVGQEGRLAEVLAGVAHHARADAAFHSSVLFQDGERQLAGELSGIGARKLALFAHVAWELCLDGAIVQRELDRGAGVLAEVGRGAALALEEGAADRAASLHHVARTGEDLSPAFHARLARVLQVLTAEEWLAGYARGDEVARRLEGIRGRLGLQALAPNERAELAAQLDGAIARAANVLDALLDLSITGA